MCEPAKGAPLAAAGVTVVLAWRAVESVAEALALGVFAACAVCIVLLVRQLWPVRRPVRSHYGERIMARAALPAPRRAIGAPRQVVHVITDARERSGHG